MHLDLRRRFSEWTLRVTTLDALGPRYVKETIETLAPEVYPCAGAVGLPFVSEAAHLARPVHATPPGKLAMCSGLLYYSYLNAVFAGRRSLVLDADNTYEEHPAERLRETYYWRPRFLQRVRRIPGYAMALRSSANNYYHSLVDNLPKLWALWHPRVRELPVQLLVPDGLRHVEAFFLEKLLPPNVIVRIVDSGTLYMPDTLLVPSFLSRQMSGCLPKAWLQFFGERVFPRRKRNKHRRIHITRRASRAGRRILNEEQLTTALARHGFESFDLESLPLQAQIELFFDAEVVVGAHGAGLTNLVFADQARVIEMHPTSRVFPHYYFLSLALGHRHSFLCGDATHRNDDFLVDVPAVERLILEGHQRAFA